MMVAHTLICFAGTLCTAGFLPILWQVWRGQRLRLPAWFMLVYAAGVAFWLVSGITAKSPYLMTLGVLQFVQLLTVSTLGFLSRTIDSD